ncbi:MAG: hydrogenase 3 maturation endopeptidase HyCI [Candidatus Diapherotrites archaeon]|nr:hydrogenase 3 maturation endopeptidase HyCI [Candidatus Diapherotrites archaeon]
MRVLMGVGNEFRRDDAAGLEAARRIKGWHCIECGKVPENFAAPVKRMNPELVVIVDAAFMGLKPGEFRRIPKEIIDQTASTTHSLPLSFLVKDLEQQVGRVIVIGIQPKEITDSEGLSPEVGRGVDALALLLRSGRLPELLALQH